MRKVFALALILVPACMRTVVDVGDTRDSLADGGSKPITTPRFTGNDPSCPAEPPSHLSTCQVAEWQSCSYRYVENGVSKWQGCTCFEKTSTLRLWDCGGPAEDEESCPEIQPESGTQCDGVRPYGCNYPWRARCECDTTDSDPRWQCRTPELAPNGKTSGPSDVPELAMIRDLNEAQRRAYCEWFQGSYMPVEFPPKESPISEEGYATNLGTVFNNQQFFADACMPLPSTVPVSYCMANLQIAPCEATVAELTDCVLTMTHGRPFPHGCGRFKDRVHCEHTIINRLDAAGDAGTGGCNGLKVR